MVLARISVWLIPLLLAGTALYALWRRVDVFSALCAGAGEGLSVTLRILPALTALLTGVYMLRASGAMELLAGLLTPILTCGHPAGDGGSAAYPPGQRQRGFGCGQRNHADLRPRQRHRAHGGGDAGKHGDDLLYRGGILRGGGDTPHPPHHPGGLGSGYYGLSGRGMDGAMDI